MLNADDDGHEDDDDDGLEGSSMLVTLEANMLSLGVRCENVGAIVAVITN